MLKYVVPCDPSFIPRLSIDFQALYVEIRSRIPITSSRGNIQGFALPEADGHRFVPWREDEEGGLTCYRVETNHLPLHKTLIVVLISSGQYRLTKRLLSIAPASEFPGKPVTPALY